VTGSDPTSLARELGSREDAVAGAAEDALVRLGGQAVPALCSTVLTGPGDAGWRAAYALGRIGDPRAVPVLCEALTTPSIRRSRNQATRLRREAAAALGRIRAPEAVPALCRALSDSRSEVAASAQWALVALGPAALPRLCQLLYRGSNAVRELAAGALGSIADPRAIEPLSHALTMDDHPVRIAAARALGKIAAHHRVPELRQAVPALRRLLSPWPLDGRNFEARYRSTLLTSLEVIETATRELKDLPVPSNAPPRSPDTLPVVAAEVMSGTDSFAAPSNDGDGDPS
jgi:HEAT repeat protein